MYKLKKIFKNEKGQGMVEYGLILATVSIVAILGLNTLGGNIKDQFEGITDSMDISEPRKYSDEEIDNLIVEGYIPIATAEDLNSVRSTEKRIYAAGTEWETENTVAGGLNKKYIQVADIDLRKFTNFELIGTSFWAFSGIYDGGGYIISNLTIDGGSEIGVGLFGGARGATFKNVGLEDVDVTGNSNHTGGLVGVQYNSSISNSYATGTVTGRSQTGGLVGDQRDSSITNSYATGSVTGGSQVGGLVGRQYGSSTVTNSYATGSVTGEYRTGGLVGSQSDSSLTDSYATGNVTGGDWTGGLVGQQSGSSVSNSYATGSVTSRSYTGGLVGDQSRSSVTNSYATGSVTGSRVTGGLVGSQDRSSVSNSYATGSVNSSWFDVGGLVGYQEGSSTVRNSYATGSVTGTSSVGGLVGRQEGSSITNSYATGSVTSTGKEVGGLVGDQYDSTVSDSYATGLVTGRHPIGGLVGYQRDGSSVTNSYYDKETTKQSDDTGKGTGKPTAEMKNKDTYVDWDFESIWEIENNQYPTLR